MAEEFYTLLTAVKSVVDGLALAFDGAAVPCALRKLPRAEDTLDTLPLVCVTLAGPETVAPFASEDLVLVQYPVAVTLIAAGNRDFTDTNLRTWLRWRERVRRQLQFGLESFGAESWNADVNPDAPLDRAKLNQNYEYSSLTVRFWTVESRTN